MPPPEPTSSAFADDLAASHFGVSGADLLIGGIPLRELAARYGTPMFVYDGGVIRRSYRALSEALSGFARIHYSIKANPAAAVIRLLSDEGAAWRSRRLANTAQREPRASGLPDILFAGPAKSARELEIVVAGGIGEIHIESFEEIARLIAIAARLDVTIPVSIRVNPVASAQGGAMRMGGKPAPFGFDEESIGEVVSKVQSAPGLDLRGVHLFAGTQILDETVLLAQWRHGIEVAGRVAAIAGQPLKTIDLGGGLGIPYYPGDAQLDLAKLSSGLPALRQQLKSDPLLADARIVVEPGRFLVGPAGVYCRGDQRRESLARHPLPDHRRRHASPSRRLREPRTDHQAGLSDRCARAHECARGIAGDDRRPALHAARFAGAKSRDAGPERRRPYCRAAIGSLRQDGKSCRVSKPTIAHRNPDRERQDRNHPSAGSVMSGGRSPHGRDNATSPIAEDEFLADEIQLSSRDGGLPSARFT